MSRVFHSDQVPDKTILDDGDFRLKLDDLTENPDSDVWQMVARMSVVEPKECEGQTHFERYTIGTADDPDATDPKTLKKFGAVNFKKLLGANGIDTSGSLTEEKYLEAVGCIFDARVRQREGKATLKDGSPNPYAGQMNANITKYCKMGELEPQLLDAPKSAKAAAKATPAKAKPVPVAAAASADEEIEVEVE